MTTTSLAVRAGNQEGSAQGQPQTDNQLARSVRLSVAEGSLATSMGSLFSGVFLTGFALAIGATDVQIGLLFTLPSLCGVAQLAGSYWIERHGRSRGLCLWTTVLSRALYLPVLLIALLATGLSAQARVWWIVALMALSGGLSSLGGVAWLSWIRALVPDRLRVSFFGRRNLANSALSFALCFAAGTLVDHWEGRPGGILGGYIAVFAAAMLCGLASSALLWLIPDGVRSGARSSEPLRIMLADPLREKNFRRVLSFYTAWNLASNLATPFFAVFYLRELGLPLGFIVILNTLTTISGLAANNFWTRLADRFGIKPIVMIATVGDALYPLLLILVSPAWAWVLLIVHCYGLFNTPITIGPDNFVLKLAPDRHNSSYIAVFKAVIGLAATVAAILGGWLAAQSSLLASMGGQSAVISGLKVVFLISFLGRIASLLLLAGVAEPGAWRVRELFTESARAFGAARRRRPAAVSPASDTHLSLPVIESPLAPAERL